MTTRTVSSRTNASTTQDGYYFLSPESRQRLPEYKYKGCDKSLLYHYVLSPLASWCVDTFIPRWMAPNTITLLGLLWMITAYVAYWYYVPTLQVPNEEPPRWIFLWNSIAMLAYQTLDNMDGKQARRTGSSSPLGLLFDHGCDSVNSIFGSANWIIGLGLNPSEDLLACWIMVFGPMILFYNSTWEQYYTGELILPILNGPNEGLLGGVLVSFFSFCWGPAYWQQTGIYDALQPTMPFLPVLRNCDFILLASAFAFVQEIMCKCIPVSRKYSGSALNLLPFIILATCYFIIGFISPNVWLNNPRTSLHLSSILFVDMCTDLMFAHVTEQPYPSWRWQTIPLVGLTLWMILFGDDSTATADVTETTIGHWLLAYTSAIGAYLGMKVVLLIHEVCTTLGIWCFDIVTPHPNNVLISNGNGHVKHH